MILKRPLIKWAWLAVSLSIAFPASASPLHAEAMNPAAAGEKEPPPSAAQGERKGVEGVAVYYAKRYHGRRTHSGGTHHEGRLLAAHPTLPHGTRVKVVNLANNRYVIVTINDRCRKRSFEVIDLSRAAARKLGFLGKGTARVRIIPLATD